MNTRRFKAVDGKGSNYRIVEKIAVYDETGKQIDCGIIHTDEDGREFYYPHNPHTKSGLFTDYPKDAWNCICADFADAFKATKLFGFVLQKPVRYLDRLYGEEARKNTLETNKGIKFAYAIKFSLLGSFNSSLLTKKETFFGLSDTPKDIMTFDTEAEAEAYIEHIEKKAQDYYKEYQVAKDPNWCTRFLNNLEGGSASIYLELLIELEESEKDEKKKHRFKVIQIVR